MNSHHRWMAISAATELVFFLVANFSRFLVDLNIVSGVSYKWNINKYRNVK